MIKYSLTCDQDHAFEGWFTNASTCDAQLAQGLVACPFCESTAVRKAPMAPAVPRKGKPASNSAEARAAKVAQAHHHMAKMLKGIREHVETNFENVGTDFAEEARRIHYGEAEERDIYGDATPDEAEALCEEGIPFATMPWARDPDA